MSKKKITKRLTFLFVCLCLIATALVINWGIVFPTPSLKTTDVSGNSKAAYQIAVYYFPTKKTAAKALSTYLKSEGYFVIIYPASKLDTLEHVGSNPSYLFFNHDEIAQAMEIKGLVERIMGYPVNAYRNTNTVSAPSLRLILTEGA